MLMETQRDLLAFGTHRIVELYDFLIDDGIGLFVVK
jgi:hypothetical protein